MEPTKLSGYTKAQIGFIRNAANFNIPTTEIAFGGKVDKNGFYACVETGYGYDIRIAGKLGKNFVLNDKFSVDTSLNAQYSKSNNKQSYYKSIFKEGNIEPTWHPNDSRIYAGATVNYAKDKYTVGIGLDSGVKHSSQPYVTQDDLDDAIGITKSTKNAGDNNKVFITPTINSNVKLDKKQHWALELKASLEEGHVGIKYNF